MPKTQNNIDSAIKTLFECPNCRIQLRVEDNNSAICVRCEFTLKKKGYIWTNPALPGLQPDNYCQNIDYVARLQNPATTTARETVQYNKILQEIVESHGIYGNILDA